MTGGARQHSAPWVAVEGRVDGHVVLRDRLRHGADPEDVLLRSGWAPVRVLEARLAGEGQRLTLAFEVEASWAGEQAGSRTPLLLVAARQPEPDPEPEPPGIPGEAVVVRQRVAAYAVVRSERGLLLTEFSERTNASGRWGPPGGGLDAGEPPEAAVLREVWEETGQRVVLSGLDRVVTGHWVGRAPGGVLEDFHAVRLVYVGTCAEPSDPVVHDVDGTTSAAAWFPAAQLPAVPLTAVWRSVVDELSRR